MWIKILKTKKNFCGKIKFIYPPLRPEKYADSMAKSVLKSVHSYERFAILCPPRLLFPPCSNAASTTTRVADTSHWATPCAAFSSFSLAPYRVSACLCTGIVCNDEMFTYSLMAVQCMIFCWCFCKL